MGTEKSINLPLVYKKGNEFFVENGLNLSRRDELWGIQLWSNVFLSLTCEARGWQNAKEFAEQMRFEGKSGHLPEIFSLRRGYGPVEKMQLKELKELLAEYDIALDVEGYVYCAAVEEDVNAPSLGLHNGGMGTFSKESVSSNDRVAVAF